LKYTDAYSAGTFEIRASVTIKAQATSPDVTGTASKDVEFKSWEIASMQVDLNGNAPTSYVDNSTSGSLPKPLIATFTGTNIPTKDVT
jgi:hypothetical protein